MTRIPSLDGLRAISIAAVMISHVAKALHLASPAWISLGNTGVRIFFVISGYLITSLLLHEHQKTSSIALKEFYIRRAYRIFPAAFVFLAIAVVVYRHEMTFLSVAAAFLYLSNYDYTRPAIFGHLWSLGVEEQFYLLWPSVLKRWYENRVAILIGVIVLAPVVRLALYYFHVPSGGYGWFPVVANNLATGCLLAVLAPKLPRVNRYLALLMVAVIVLTPFFHGNTISRTVLVLFLFEPLMHFSIAGVIWHVIHEPYRILNSFPVDWLGRISYSLYLWQEPFCPNPRFRPLTAIVLALVAACLSYYLVEQPLLRIREKRSKTRKQVLPVHDAAEGPSALAS